MGDRAVEMPYHWTGDYLAEEYAKERKKFRDFGLRQMLLANAGPSCGSTLVVVNIPVGSPGMREGDPVLHAVRESARSVATCVHTTVPAS